MDTLMECWTLVPGCVSQKNADKCTIPLLPSAWQDSVRLLFSSMWYKVSCWPSPNGITPEILRCDKKCTMTWQCVIDVICDKWNRSFPLSYFDISILQQVYHAKIACCLAHFFLLFGKGICPWNNNLRTTEIHTYLKQSFSATITPINKRSVMLINLWINPIVCWYCL